jgi:hypothetical protein
MPEYKPYITTYKSIGGWKAVLLKWDNEVYYEPWQTGMCGYATEKEAIQEAKEWAMAEEIEYRERNTHASISSIDLYLEDKE